VVIKGECNGRVAAMRHAGITPDIFRGVCPDGVILRGNAREILAACPHEIKQNLKYTEVPPPLPVVFLNAERSVVKELRKKGWHFGYSRNAKDIDKGLEWIFTDCHDNSRVYEIKKWYRAVSQETEAITNGITAIWYPGADINSVKEAINNIVEITANTALEAIEQLGDRWQN
jgi:hypothetical protein